MKASELIESLQFIVGVHGDQDVVVDTGMALCVLEEVDLGASDEGIIIWAGDLVGAEA